MALEICAEDRSAPAVPDRQMDEMRGERRRSRGLAAPPIRRAGVADLGPPVHEADFGTFQLPQRGA